ncbi:MAG: hypothetical protein NZ704_05120 [Geminicoccaceae bacterium]|nr:hypothetical protein [Geminicoccaceae bacterium]
MTRAPLALLVLAACAVEPAPRLDPASDPALARRELLAAAASGPVPIVVVAPDGRPTASEAAALAARGITGLSVRFVPVSPPGEGRRLVLAPWGLRDPATACTGASRPAPIEEARPLLAAWCDGERVIARIEVPAAAERVERERAIWRATARLFPDPYAETYGFELFGLRIAFGARIGF